MKFKICNGCDAGDPTNLIPFGGCDCKDAGFYEVEE